MQVEVGHALDNRLVVAVWIIMVIMPAIGRRGGVAVYGIAKIFVAIGMRPGAMGMQGGPVLMRMP